MINYDVVDTRIHHVYNGLKVQVNCTSELNNQQAFFMNKLKSSDTYKNMDILDIYKKEYERIDKITEEHVKRGVRDIQKVFTNLGLGQDYIELAKSAHELHDVARRVQFMITGTVVDADSYDQQVIASRGLESSVDPKIMSHAAHGAYLLDNFLFSNLHIEEKYREIISTAVRYHSNHVLPVELGKAVSENLFDGLCLDEALKKEKYNDFKLAFEEIAKSKNIQQIIPVIKIDSIITAKDVNKKTIQDLEMLEPFGEKNKNPIFVYKNLKIDSIRALSEGKHLKLTLKDDNLLINAIGFNLGYLSEEYLIGDKIDIAGNLEINKYGRRRDNPNKYKR